MRWFHVFCLFFFCSISSCTDSENTNNKKSIAVIKQEMKKLHQSLKIGTTSLLLDKQAILQFGYAECAMFARMLQDNLSEKGLPSRQVGIVSTSGGSHNMLEIKVGQKWILADPMSLVLYDHSLFEVLMEPSRSRKKLLNNSQPPAPNLVRTSFFAKAIEVYPGEVYLSDFYRFFPVLDETGKPKNYICETSACQWEIPIPETIQNDMIFKKLPFIKIITSDSLTMDINLLKVNGEYLPWRIPVKNDKWVFTSRAAGQHGFYLKYMSAPLTDTESLDMRIPVPSVLIFRNASLDFYDAQFYCDKKLRWQKGVEQGKFHNAFFMPEDHTSSAWSNINHREDLAYRSSVIELPSNEPRIRILPYAFQKNSACELVIHYRSDDFVHLLMYVENSNEIFEFENMKPCEKKMCEYRHAFKREEVAAMVG